MRVLGVDEEGEDARDGGFPDQSVTKLSGSDSVNSQMAVGPGRETECYSWGPHTRAGLGTAVCRL